MSERLLVVVSFILVSQNADERIGAILNRADRFEQERTCPILGDSMKVDFLKLMSKTLIGYYFNRPDKTLESIDKLLVDCRSEIGSGFNHILGERFCTFQLLK